MDDDNNNNDNNMSNNNNNNNMSNNDSVSEGLGDGWSDDGGMMEILSNFQDIDENMEDLLENLTQTRNPYEDIFHISSNNNSMVNNSNVNNNNNNKYSKNINNNSMRFEYSLDNNNNNNNKLNPYDKSTVSSSSSSTTLSSLLFDKSGSNSQPSLFQELKHRNQLKSSNSNGNNNIDNSINTNNKSRKNASSSGSSEGVSMIVNSGKDDNNNSIHQLLKPSSSSSSKFSGTYFSEDTTNIMSNNYMNSLNDTNMHNNASAGGFGDAGGDDMQNYAHVGSTGIGGGIMYNYASTGGISGAGGGNMQNNAGAGGSSSSRPTVKLEPTKNDDMSFDVEDRDSDGDLLSDGGDTDDDDDGLGASGSNTDGGDSKRRREHPRDKGNRTFEEKAKEKNRVHAKNTRMRKKNYIESLKESIKKLYEENDRSDRERRIVLSRIAEQFHCRKRVLNTFFQYRQTPEANRNKWVTLLTENFMFTSPITPYRSYPPSQIENNLRMFVGIDDMIHEAISFNIMIQSIGQPQEDSVEKIRVQYSIDQSSVISEGDTMMCKWVFRTENAVKRGARFEVYKHGMVKAVFNPQSKITTLDMTFDVLSFTQQLRKASGRHDFQKVPNTLALARDASSDARMIVEFAKPYKIVHVNETWCELLGYTPDQVIDKNVDILYGQATESDKLDYLATQLSYSRPVMLTLTNYTADGMRLKNSVRYFPLYNEGDATHFLVVMESIQERRQPVVRKMIEKEELVSISSGYSNSGKSTAASYSSSSIFNSSSRSGNDSSESQSITGHHYHHYLDDAFVEDFVDDKIMSTSQIPQWKIKSSKNAELEKQHYHNRS